MPHGHGAIGQGGRGDTRRPRFFKPMGRTLGVNALTMGRSRCNDGKARTASAGRGVGKIFHTAFESGLHATTMPVYHEQRGAVSRPLWP
jgi:hypothetical protein